MFSVGDLNLQASILQFRKIRGFGGKDLTFDPLPKNVNLKARSVSKK